MTYAELIKCYPWVDLAMELFKGIAPTVIAFVTIFLTEYFVKRRNDTYKKREMKLQYLEKMLAWFHEMRRRVFEISSSLNKVLAANDIGSSDRVSKLNEVIGQITEMNKSAFVLCDTYKDISCSMGYEFKFDQFRDAIKNYSATVYEIGGNYINCLDVKEARDKINCVTVKTSESMKETILLLVKEINLLYGK